jgi:acetate kinase
VGERSPEIRARTVDRLGFLSLAIDDQLNTHARDDQEITRPGALVRTVVLRAREDLEIARQTRAVIGTCRGDRYQRRPIL